MSYGWRELLMARRPPTEILDWLRNEFLPLVLSSMNTPDVRRRIGLYGGDRIPENERNLTDVRNRVSLVAEYEMARVATQLLEDRGFGELFFSYVVANRFPDLELRNENGKHGIRIEVKCLESVAEEKSANFDTLKKDINPRTDFLVIFLWEWKHDGSVVGPGEDRRLAWDRAPEFLEVFCFHASSLAHMRDWYWLNKPPPGLGDGLQGFDLRYGVNCNNGKYNEEEGNYGKLMRMWANKFEPAPARSDFLSETPERYLSFRRDVIEQGFMQVCRALASEVLAKGTVLKPLHHDQKAIGVVAEPFIFVLGSVCSNAIKKKILKDCGQRRLFVLSDKYSWSQIELSGNKILGIDKGKKPKHLKTHLRDLHQLPPPHHCSHQDQSGSLFPSDIV